MVNLVTTLFQVQPAKVLVLRKTAAARAKSKQASLLDWEALEACIRQGDLLF